METTNTSLTGEWLKIHGQFIAWTPTTIKRNKALVRVTTCRGTEGNRAEWKSQSQEVAYLTWQNYGAGEQTGDFSGMRVGEGKEVAEDVKSRVSL